jgi:leucyl aminopeptidase (aminopeptidase T)
MSKLYYGPLREETAPRTRETGRTVRPDARWWVTVTVVTAPAGGLRRRNVPACLRPTMASDSVSSATRTKVARSVLTKNLQVKPGERVVVEAWTHTLPWAVTFAREARRLGAQPLVPYEDEDGYWDAVTAGEDDVLGKPARHEWAALEKTDVYIHMWGPGDRVRLNALPEKQANRLFRFNPEWYRTAGKSGVRGARMEIGRPYPTLARAYGVDLAAWTDQLIRATMVSPDALAASAAPIAKALERGKRLHLRDDAGTDLTLGLARRPTRSYVGRLSPAERKRPFGFMTTLPSGVVNVALDETVADGTIVGNRTSYYDDERATGGVFRFKNGKLTSAEFDRGQRRFDSEFKKGGKGRDRPGQFRLGLNPALHDTPQVEDTELGAVTLSVGGNSGLGGKNMSPLFGWIVNAGSTIEVDGRALPIRG